LNELAEKMIAETNKLFDLREAITVESTRLKEIHDIEFQINSLTALIDSQNVRKESSEREMEERQNSFDEEMRLKHEEWKKEQQEHEISVKERDELIKKQRQRDEEEYKYRITIERRKETDEYVSNKLKLQQELRLRLLAWHAH